MSKPPFEVLEMILKRAAQDQAFRDELLSSPIEAGKKECVLLEKDSLDILESLKEDLKRFGGNASLDSQDAASWAAGLLLTKIIRPTKKSWDMHVTTILRDFGRRP